jgi:hypothetical protein
MGHVCDFKFSSCYILNKGKETGEINLDSFM